MERLFIRLYAAASRRIFSPVRYADGRRRSRPPGVVSVRRRPCARTLRNFYITRAKLRDGVVRVVAAIVFVPERRRVTR